jgi:hypothetical protein
MATYYWYNGSGTWDAVTATNWSTSLAGPRNLSPAPNAPTSADTVVFDGLSGTGTVTVSSSSGAPTCLTLTASAIPAALVLTPTPGAIIDVYGSVNFGANATGSLALYMSSTTIGNTVTISSANIVQSIFYIGSGTFTQSASTVINPTGATGIGIGGSGSTVTFSGAITTNKCATP